MNRLQLAALWLLRAWIVVGWLVFVPLALLYVGPTLSRAMGVIP